jgi:hypothetical protein
MNHGFVVAQPDDLTTEYNKYTEWISDFLPFVPWFRRLGNNEKDEMDEIWKTDKPRTMPIPTLQVSSISPISLFIHPEPR